MPPSPVSTSGLTSASVASHSQYARDRPCSACRAAASEASGMPMPRAMASAWASVRPATGSISTRWIFSGVCAATSSISTPPSLDAMRQIFCADRSRTRPAYSSLRMSTPSSMSSRRTVWPCTPVWWVTNRMPSMSCAWARTSSSERASLTPPPLPRPPAWICALTTHSGPPSRRAASTASATPNAGSPRGTGTPKRRRISLAWYSWIFKKGLHSAHAGRPQY